MILAQKYVSFNLLYVLSVVYGVNMCEILTYLSDNDLIKKQPS